VVVLTKADLCADPQADACAACRRCCRPTPWRWRSTRWATNRAAALAPWLTEGSTLVLLGSSGAGKSTLTNALLGPTCRLVGAARAGDGRGRHTTTVAHAARHARRRLHHRHAGLRTLRLDGDAGPSARCSTTSRSWRRSAASATAATTTNPAARCAGVPPERLRNYHKLLREARRDTLTALQRKAQVAQWKQRSRAAKARRQGQARLSDGRRQAGPVQRRHQRVAPRQRREAAPPDAPPPGRCRCRPAAPSPPAPAAPRWRRTRIRPAGCWRR
jgi:ribosome biogenesis GTPase